MGKYDSASADDATEALSRFYLQQKRFLSSPWLDPVTTTVCIIANSIMMRRNGLWNAVLAKNGIEKIQSDGPVCHNYLPEIVAAAEKRGSNAAAGIKTYNEFVQGCEKAFNTRAGKQEYGFAKRVWFRLAIAKGYVRSDAPRP